MATSKQYDHLIKPLSIGAIDWEEKKGSAWASAMGPGNARKEIWLNGRDHLGGMKLNLSWGVHNTTGEWHSGSRQHAHPFPECLFFVGLDTANVKYLGAEVECCLGDEREAHVFNDPTVVVIPPGMPHGPINTKKLFSPRGFGFLAASLGAAPEIQWLDAGAEGKPQGLATGKYDALVKPLREGLITERGRFVPSRLTPEELARREEMQKKTGFKPGPGSPDHLVWMYGRDLGGFPLNVAWGFASSPGLWQRGVNAHTHPSDEILIFQGTDPDNPDSLGAEIEIDLGKERERHVFSQSTVVLCPAGLPHAPIVTRWVDRPFAFLLINLAGEPTLSFE